MTSLVPSQKTAVPTLAGALATLTAALIKHQIIDPTTISLAAMTVGQAVIGFLTPHKPIPLPKPRRRPRPVPAPAPQFVTVFDATSSKNLARVVSSSRDAVAGYDDGLYNDVGQMRRDYPGHLALSICVRAGDRADFLDNEPQNVKPGADAAERARLAVQWALDQHAAGASIVGLYGDRDDWRYMDIELTRRGISLKPRYQGGPICRWVADPTGEVHIPVGFDGCQWKFAGTFDESIFYAVALKGA